MTAALSAAFDCFLVVQWSYTPLALARGCLAKQLLGRDLGCIVVVSTLFCLICPGQPLYFAANGSSQYGKVLALQVFFGCPAILGLLRNFMPRGAQAQIQS